MDAHDESMETIFGGEEEDEINERVHENLLTCIFALNGKRRNTNVVRGLPSTPGGADLIVHASTSKIRLEDLNVKQRKGKSQLKKPRSGLETEKVQRQVARDTLVSEMSKWDPVVSEIRAAPQIVFSKRPHGIKMYEAVQPKPFTPRTPLEKEIYEALGKSEDIIRPNQELTVAEQRALKVMSVKEAKQRHGELLRHHELLSRMELKAKWQNKIKSKRYRKIVRKEKVMAEKKLLEELQKANPEAFLERLEQIEKDRMEERLTLKHRGGGKFSQMHKAYSKFDDKTREAIQEMLQKSRELTKKKQEESSEDESGITSEANRKNESDDEGDNDDAKKMGAKASQLEFLKVVTRKAGGWLDVPKTFVYAQPTSETSAAAQTDGAVVENMKIDTPVNNTGDSSLEINMCMEPHSQDDGETEEGCTLSAMSDFQHASPAKDPCNKVIPTLNNTSGDLAKHQLGHTQNQRESCSEDRDMKGHGIQIIKWVSEKPQCTAEEPKKKERRQSKKNKKKDPRNGGLLVSKKNAVAEVLLQPVAEKMVDNDDDGMKLTMEELFQDEDVVEQFVKEKAEAEERILPKLKDTKLPGWGSWSGPDYNQNERQKRKITTKAYRKNTQQQTNVWLNPNRDVAIRQLQPKTVPFPHTSVDQYEASIRQPISRGFVRESALKLLTKPEIVLKLGQVVRPLNKEDYFTLA